MGDEQQEQQQSADEKPAQESWREASSAGELVRRFNAEHGHVDDDQQVNSWERQVEDAYGERAGQMREAAALQQEAMKRYVAGDERPEYAGATDLADFMAKYTAGGGAVASGWTIEEDPSTGQQLVYEMG